SGRRMSWLSIGRLRQMNSSSWPTRPAATRLGFGLLLKAFAYQGRFPRHTHELPATGVVHVARRVGVPPDLYPSYHWWSRTIKYHRVQIPQFLGFREATVKDGHELLTWLAQQVLPHDARDEHVREAVFERCRALRIEPPSSGRIDRLVR